MTRTPTAENLSLSAAPDVDEIDRLLPQTQCGKCGHPSCRPYAEAISQGEAINRCPPGGEETLAALAALLNRDIIPLDETRGQPGLHQLAYIREDECIGCTKCIQACPVDAILGAAKQMHTVIVDECSGCDLCVEPCPVDCIDMIPAPAPDPDEKASRRQADHWRQRFEARELRLSRGNQDEQLDTSDISPAKQAEQSAPPVIPVEQAKLDIKAAVERVRAKRERLRNE